MTAGYLVPNPPGRYNVTLTIGTLTDHTRNDPSVETPTPRTLVLSVFQPTRCASTVAVTYMPNKTAEFQGPYLQRQFNISADFTPLFLEARLPVCPDEPNGSSTLDDGPILLFSGGWNIPRLYYNVIASAIASEGFTVISIDHPGDTNIITYPDGHAVVGRSSGFPTIDEFAQYTSARAADATFIIDQLSNATAVAELLPQRGPREFCTDRVGMLGHSLGGAAAVQAAGQDPRVRGAIDLDGAFHGSVPSSGVFAPVMYVMSEELSKAPYPTLDKLWPQLKGPKLWLKVANTTHMSLSDALTLLQAAGQDTAAFGDLLGTIAPTELVRLLVAYTAAWMRGAFAGKVGGPLLEEKEPGRFPEAKTVKKSNF
ncbi:PAF acetylhydrolase family protein [Karstenula rhodostoma CBS 690.94]|uniref:1-alkyl-2-acetylglycerophosphocholine esterase n=1 Tax=Karstenula rhodostoma CBS 690.94 TaxID=1392251 RepID=A0A9P4PUR5_9PLEO|nr:PAF acetylhydrolase family protein [Karstenula rhodostoma CBS 690.94]